jgi:small-conductance mechanosensitive channel
MTVLPVWGQGAESTAWPVSASPYEPGLMVLAVTAILVTGGAIVRLLLMLGLIRRLVWILPVLIFLTGGLWLFLRIGRFADVPQLTALIGFLLSFLIFVAILVPAARWLLPSRALQTRGGVPALLRAMGVVVIGSVGMFVLLSWSFPGLSFTPVFVTSGVVSIVLGLALQEALGNLMAGIVMSVERPFKIGDWIQLGTTEGEAVEQTWRATVVRTRAGDHLLIPNNLAVREIMVNYDRPTSEHLVKIQVGVAYDTPCGVAVESLLDAAAKVAEVLRTPAPSVFLKDFLDSSILYELRVWIDNYGSLHAIESDVRKQIWYSFKRYGVTIPFPQRDVNIHRQMDRPLEACSRLVVTGGPLQGAMFMLGEAPATLGRAAENTIIVTDPHVSSRHLVIEPQEGGHRLRDLGSRYGTLLNGQLIESAQLAQGDEIRVGSVVFVYETHVAPVSVRVERRVVPAPPGRHVAPGSTVATSNTAIKETTL